MRTNCFTVVLLFAIAACGSPPPGNAEPYDAEEIVADVTALTQDWAIAGSEGRWDDLKNIYADADGFAWIEQGRIAYDGHDAIVAGLDQAAQMNADISTAVGDIAVTPLAVDAAVVIADVNFSFTADEFAFDFDGVFSAVAIKRDGKWVFLHGHLSEPHSIDAPAGE